MFGALGSPAHEMSKCPLRLAAGASAALPVRSRSPRLAAVWVRFDVFGPAALDAALLQPLVATENYLSCWLASWLVILAWPRMTELLRVLLMGNFAWMLFTAGTLYAGSEQRLRLRHRFDERPLTSAPPSS